MRPILLTLTLPLLSLGACKWTEFDDLRDEAWVHSTPKPDGSKSSNWGVAIVRGKATSDAGGRLAVFGSASSRLNEIEYDERGGAKQLPEQNLGNIGIGNLSVEPIVLGDPTTDEFALITQGSAQQVVVAAGADSNLLQFIINGATSVDAAAYVRAPLIGSDEAHGARTAGQPAQPVIAANDTLFGTFFENPDAPSAFIQPKCVLSDNGVPLGIRGVGAVPSGDGFTDDIAVWTAAGDMIVLDGHLFNGGRSGTATPLCPAEALDIAVATTPIIKSKTPVGFTPDLGSMSQIIPIDDRFALLQGHSASAGFLAIWDFEGGVLDPMGKFTAGAVVGATVEEAGLRAADLYNDNGDLHVVAGYPNAIVEGSAAGNVKVLEVNTTAGFTGVTELFTDSQPEDGQAFGRSVAVFEFNGLPVISVAGNNEVYTYFRTPLLYNTDRRAGR